MYKYQNEYLLLKQNLWKYRKDDMVKKGECFLTKRLFRAIIKLYSAKNTYKKVNHYTEKLTTDTHQ